MRILTGVKPSGHLQIGNYFGAIKPALELQSEGEGVYFIADYHALTTVHNADDFRGYIQEVELGWRILDPVEDFWASRTKPDQYPAGTAGPPSADALMARDNRAWRRL